MRNLKVKSYKTRALPDRFRLLPDHLIHIDKILQEYFAPIGEFTIEYRVSRNDGLSYQSESTQELLNEPNFRWQRVRHLTIEAQSSRDDVSYELWADISFSEDSGCHLTVKGRDPKIVDSLARKMEQYLSHEVVNIRLPFERTLTRLSLALLIFGGVYALAARRSIS